MKMRTSGLNSANLQKNSVEQKEDTNKKLTDNLDVNSSKAVWKMQKDNILASACALKDIIAGGGTERSKTNAAVRAKRDILNDAIIDIQKNLNHAEYDKNAAVNKLVKLLTAADINNGKGVNKDVSQNESAIGKDMTESITQFVDLVAQLAKHKTTSKTITDWFGFIPHKTDHINLLLNARKYQGYLAPLKAKFNESAEKAKSKSKIGLSHNSKQNPTVKESSFFNFGNKKNNESKLTTTSTVLKSTVVAPPPNAVNEQSIFAEVTELLKKVCDDNGNLAPDSKHQPEIITKEETAQGKTSGYAFTEQIKQAFKDFNRGTVQMSIYRSPEIQKEIKDLDEKMPQEKSPESYNLKTFKEKITEASNPNELRKILIMCNQTLPNCLINTLTGIILDDDSASKSGYLINTSYEPSEPKNPMQALLIFNKSENNNNQYDGVLHYQGRLQKHIFDSTSDLVDKGTPITCIIKCKFELANFDTIRDDDVFKSISVENIQIKDGYVSPPIIDLNENASVATGATEVNA